MSRRPFPIACALLLGVASTSAARPEDAWRSRPARVLLVIGDQWLDPNGRLIGAPDAREGGDPGPEADLLQLATLFKSWGVPFDIARLDQELLNRYHFLGPDDVPRYGAIVWAADPEARIRPQDLSLVRDAVETHGISLIALSNRIRHPILEAILGLRYVGYNRTSDDLVLQGEHFITRGLPSQLDADDPPTLHKRRVRAEARDTETLVRQGEWPQATVRAVRLGTSAIWIGGDHQHMLDYPAARTLLKRALVWAVGFSVYRDWSDSVIMQLDDPGGAQCAWLEHWHYPTLSEEQIEERLIAPLKEHGALLVVNLNPGFVNDEKRRVEPAWTQRFEDGFGTMQDYASTRRGIRAGIEAGVFEVQSHGWTHMQHDLVSEPGPWYGAELDGERAEVGWYREFRDERRGEDVPAAQQLFHMRTSVRWIESQFGVTPLHLRLGGGANSTGYVEDTHLLAARAGFGVAHGAWAGPDLVLRVPLFLGSADAPAVIDSLPDGHDRGVAREPAAFAEVFDEWKEHRFIGWNEYVAYTHAGLEGAAAPAGLDVSFGYDPHYCRHFAERTSSWTLHTADWLRESLGRESWTVETDGVAADPIRVEELATLEVPVGIGRHELRLR
jgi:hypothetical protein